MVFFVYGAWAFVLFGENDPSHFGSMAMSIWTLFQFSTMDVSPSAQSPILSSSLTLASLSELE
jgi:hypothetical protein